MVKTGNGDTIGTDPAQEYGPGMREFRAAKLRVFAAFEEALLSAVQRELTGSVSIKVQFVGGRQQPRFESVTTNYQQ